MFGEIGKSEFLNENKREKISLLDYDKQKKYFKDGFIGTCLEKDNTDYFLMVKYNPK